MQRERERRKEALVESWKPVGTGGGDHTVQWISMWCRKNCISTVHKSKSRKRSSTRGCILFFLKLCFYIPHTVLLDLLFDIALIETLMRLTRRLLVSSFPIPTLHRIFSQLYACIQIRKIVSSFIFSSNTNWKKRQTLTMIAQFDGQTSWLFQACVCLPQVCKSATSFLLFFFFFLAS